MKHGLLALLLTALFTSVGCGANGGAESIAPTQSEESEGNKAAWKIELSVSGGLAGISRQLVVDNTGKVSASDRRRGHVEGRLEAEELAALERALSELDTVPAQQNTLSFPQRCADCLEYRLNIRFNGNQQQAAFVSGKGPAEPYAELFRQLGQLLQRILK